MVMVEFFEVTRDGLFFVLCYFHNLSLQEKVLLETMVLERPRKPALSIVELLFALHFVPPREPSLTGFFKIHPHAHGSTCVNLFLYGCPVLSFSLVP